MPTQGTNQPNTYPVAKACSRGELARQGYRYRASQLVQARAPATQFTGVAPSPKRRPCQVGDNGLVRGRVIYVPMRETLRGAFAYGELERYSSSRAIRSTSINTSRSGTPFASAKRRQSSYSGISRNTLSPASATLTRAVP